MSKLIDLGLLSRFLTDCKRIFAKKKDLDKKYEKPASGIPASDIENGVIPSYGMADANNLGLVRVDKIAGGINKDSNGKLILDTASNAEIEARTTVCALKVSQIDKAVKEGVANNSITLTSAEQTAAKSWLGVNDTPEIFWATYGTTTAAEVKAAYDAGKVVVCNYNNAQYRLTECSTNNSSYFFQADYAGTLRSISVNRSNDTWSPSNPIYAENISHRVTSLSSSSTDTEYPSAKATYDNIRPATVSLQPAGGFLPNIVYDLGTLSGNTTFALATPTDANVVNHYYWTFDTGSTAPTITWPTGLTWIGGSAPTINASKHYEISVLNNIGTFMEV